MTTASILIVDDDAFFRGLFVELLSDFGYAVEAVDSGNEALKRLAGGKIDVLLTDLLMPGISGIELLRFCRTLANPPDVILVTGNATLETAVETLKAGARDYLVKPFKPEELQHLVRTCIEQRRLLNENAILKRQIRLFQRGQNLASLIEIDRILPLAITTLLSEIGQGRGYAFLATSDEILNIHGMDGVSEEEATALASVLLPRLREMTSLNILKGTELPTISGAPEQIETLCVFPLRCEQSFKGSLVLINPAECDFAASLPLDNLVFLSEQTALGFENAFRYQGARELIYTDDLTGLYNYRYLQVMLDQEIRRTDRYGLCFSLVFIDLDYFKEINDSRGHLAGSEVLAEIARLLKKNVREVDILFRYGGDEFTALLVETDNDGAAVVAERIRKSIEQHHFFPESAFPVRLTATVGYATFPENASDKNTILDMADRAMYDGKKQRNVVRGAWEVLKT